MPWRLVQPESLGGPRACDRWCRPAGMSGAPARAPAGSSARVRVTPLRNVAALHGPPRSRRRSRPPAAAPVAVLMMCGRNAWRRERSRGCRRGDDRHAGFLEQRPSSASGESRADVAVVEHLSTPRAMAASSAVGRPPSVTLPLVDPQHLLGLRASSASHGSQHARC